MEDELFWLDGKQLCLGCLNAELEGEIDGVELESVEDNGDTDY
jgi:hypothetical protein